MTDNSCAKCRYAILPNEFRRITGIKCDLTGRQATGLCELFMQEVGHGNCVFTVSPAAEDPFVALASALGYQVRSWLQM